MTPPERYDRLVERTVAAVTTTPGHTSPRLRKALVERTDEGVPPELVEYVATVRRHAWKVTDADVDALKREGYDDDEIFELTGAIALGAALHRLDRAMAAVRAGRSS